MYSTLDDKICCFVTALQTDTYKRFQIWCPNQQLGLVTLFGHLLSFFWGGGWTVSNIRVVFTLVLALFWSLCSPAIRLTVFLLFGARQVALSETLVLFSIKNAARSSLKHSGEIDSKAAGHIAKTMSWQTLKCGALHLRETEELGGNSLWVHRHK